MKKRPLIFLFLLFFVISPLTSGCGSILPFFSEDEESDSFEEESDSPESESGIERDVSGKLALALGGVAPGTDAIQTDEDLTGKTLGFETEDDDLITFAFIESFNSYQEGRGARVIPKAFGIGYAIPVVNNSYRQAAEIIIPPQKFIQILLGEARGQLTREAVLDHDGMVKPGSVSPTGNALGAVIRNRIKIIRDQNAPHLFVADSDLFYADYPITSYEAVIEAGSGGHYQFSPLYPDDPTHDEYLDAAHRVNVADDNLIAYDQAVLTAAYIFNDDTQDPTQGAFAFYSPTTLQYDTLQEALISGDTEFPSGAGTSNQQYPALAPIQVLILPDVSTRSSESSVPSFVFVRERNENDPAVTNKP